MVILFLIPLDQIRPEWIKIDKTRLYWIFLPGIEILHQFGVVFPPAHQVVDDAAGQVHDVVVELLAEPVLAVGVQPVGRGQVLDHGLGHQFQKEPAGL